MKLKKCIFTLWDYNFKAVYLKIGSLTVTIDPRCFSCFGFIYIVPGLINDEMCSTFYLLISKYTVTLFAVISINKSVLVLAFQT